MKKKVGQEVEDLMMHAKFMKGLKEDKAIAKQKQQEYQLNKMMLGKSIKLSIEIIMINNWKFQDQIQILQFNNRQQMPKCRH